jgi:hypothetical protein
MRRLITFAVTFTVLAAAAISPVAAAKPFMETIVIDDHFVESGLCPFDVTVDGSGRIRFAVFFDKDGNVVKEVNNFAIRVSYSANGETVNVVDTGVDLVKFSADGSFTVAITGNIQLATDAGTGVISGSAGRTLLLLTPTGEVDEEGFPIFDVTVLSEKGKRATGDLCAVLA